MIALLAAALAFAATAVVAEGRLARGRTQAALPAMLATHAVAAAGAAAVARLGFGVSAGALLGFWGGALLVWIGLRAHVESSIVLTLLDELLEGGPREPAGLVSRYEARNGAEARLEELARARFVAAAGDGLVVLPRGRWVRGVVAGATRLWRRRPGPRPPGRGEGSGLP